jgi:hypothetical protein
MYKRISDMNTVEMDEKLFTLHELDSGYLRGNLIPGKTEIVHPGVVQIGGRISKKRPKVRKGHYPNSQ